MFEHFSSVCSSYWYSALYTCLWLITAELAFYPRVSYNPMYAHIRWVPRQSGQGVMLTSASRAEVMNEWIYTFAPPVCLNGVCSVVTALPLLRPLQ
jgi:hypothetical protein